MRLAISCSPLAFYFLEFRSWTSLHPLVPEKSNSAILDKFVPECFYRGRIRAQALDKNIRAQAFWQDLKSQIAKNQLTNADGSASIKIKALDSSSYFVRCDLQFEIYPRLNLSPNSLIGEHSGTSLGFDIWYGFDLAHHRFGFPACPVGFWFIPRGLSGLGDLQITIPTYSGLNFISKKLIAKSQSLKFWV